jgi:hypothetical protein
MGNTEGVAVGDVNGDTFPDIGLAMYGQGLVVYVNQRTGFSRAGRACAGNLALAPVLGTSGEPKLGNQQFAFTVGQAPANAPALFWLGASKTLLFGQPLLPFDLSGAGAPGCWLQAPPLFVFATAVGAQGMGSLPAPIPNDFALWRSTVFGQWGVTASGANALGIVFSELGAARIGN